MLFNDQIAKSLPNYINMLCKRAIQQLLWRVSAYVHIPEFVQYGLCYQACQNNIIL